MDKQKAVYLLREYGYTAELINGVVLVERMNRHDFTDVGKILRDAGYADSYGIVAKLRKEKTWEL